MEKASPSNNYHYNKSLQPYANHLRKTMTKSEACLWKFCLRGRRMMGYRFRRQRPVLNYIADFMCMELMLIIEVDGYTHDDDKGIAKDKKRDQDLAAIGITTLRVSSWEVLYQIDDVSIFIGEWIEKNAKKASIE